MTSRYSHNGIVSLWGGGVLGLGGRILLHCDFVLWQVPDRYPLLGLQLSSQLLWIFQLQLQQFNPSIIVLSWKCGCTVNIGISIKEIKFIRSSVCLCMSFRAFFQMQMECIYFYLTWNYVALVRFPVLPQKEHFLLWLSSVRSYNMKTEKNLLNICMTEINCCMFDTLETCTESNFLEIIQWKAWSLL